MHRRSRIRAKSPIPHIMFLIVGWSIATLFVAWVATILVFGRAIPAVVGDTLSFGAIGTGVVAWLVLLTCWRE